MKGILFSNKDLVASFLRTQIDKLRILLLSIENDDIESSYLDENLKKVEKNLQKLRKICVNIHE